MLSAKKEQPEKPDVESMPSPDQSPQSEESPTQQSMYLEIVGALESQIAILKPDFSNLTFIEKEQIDEILQELDKPAPKELFEEKLGGEMGYLVDYFEICLKRFLELEDRIKLRGYFIYQSFQKMLAGTDNRQKKEKMQCVMVFLEKLKDADEIPGLETELSYEKAVSTEAELNYFNFLISDADIIKRGDAKERIFLSEVFVSIGQKMQNNQLVLFDSQPVVDLLRNYYTSFFLKIKYDIDFCSVNGVFLNPYFASRIKNNIIFLKDLALSSELAKCSFGFFMYGLQGHGVVDEDPFLTLQQKAENAGIDFYGNLSDDIDKKIENLIAGRGRVSRIPINQIKTVDESSLEAELALVNKILEETFEDFGANRFDANAFINKFKALGSEARQVLLQKTLEKPYRDIIPARMILNDLSELVSPMVDLRLWVAYYNEAQCINFEHLFSGDKNPRYSFNASEFEKVSLRIQAGRLLRACMTHWFFSDSLSAGAEPNVDLKAFFIKTETSEKIIKNYFTWFLVCIQSDLGFEFKSGCSNIPMMENIAFNIATVEWAAKNIGHHDHDKEIKKTKDLLFALVNHRAEEEPLFPGKVFYYNKFFDKLDGSYLRGWLENDFSNARCVFELYLSESKNTVIKFVTFMRWLIDECDKICISNKFGPASRIYVNIHKFYKEIASQFRYYGNFWSIFESALSREIIMLVFKITKGSFYALRQSKTIEINSLFDTAAIFTSIGVIFSAENSCNKFIFFKGDLLDHFWDNLYLWSVEFIKFNLRFIIVTLNNKNILSTDSSSRLNDLIDKVAQAIDFLFIWESKSLLAKHSFELFLSQETGDPADRYAALEALTEERAIIFWLKEVFVFLNSPGATHVLLKNKSQWLVSIKKHKDMKFSEKIKLFYDDISKTHRSVRNSSSAKLNSDDLENLKKWLEIGDRNDYYMSLVEACVKQFGQIVNNPISSVSDPLKANGKEQIQVQPQQKISNHERSVCEADHSSAWMAKEDAKIRDQQEKKEQKKKERQESRMQKETARQRREKERKQVSATPSDASDTSSDNTSVQSSFLSGNLGLDGERGASWITVTGRASSAIGSLATEQKSLDPAMTLLTSSAGASFLSNGSAVKLNTSHSTLSRKRVQPNLSHKIAVEPAQATAREDVEFSPVAPQACPVESSEELKAQSNTDVDSSPNTSPVNQVVETVDAGPSVDNESARPLDKKNGDLAASIISISPMVAPNDTASELKPMLIPYPEHLKIVKACEAEAYRMGVVSEQQAHRKKQAEADSLMSRRIQEQYGQMLEQYGQDGYNQGCKQGYEAGYSNGHLDGFVAGMLQSLQIVGASLAQIQSVFQATFGDSANAYLPYDMQIEFSAQQHTSLKVKHKNDP